MAATAREIAGITAGVAAGVIGLAATLLTTVVRRPLPQTSGALTAPGLLAPVEILRDRWGVPHIYARNNADLFFAQGYVHAQDRLWQMELQRRTGLGQLAEILGPIALESDRFLRTLGFGRVARQEATAMSGAEHEAVTAYCRGVNAFLAANKRHLPIEFTLLRCRPRRWEPTDIFAFGKVMALNLSLNWTSEILRAQIVATRGAARMAALDPTYPPDQPLAIPGDADDNATLGADMLRAIAALDPFAGGQDGTQGSNAWVVSGARTTSGGPLLANDPHLALQMPALWYENHLIGGDYAVTGASIPGTVGVIIGHNERIAWGVTNGMNDVQDLYIERFDPAEPHGTRYEFRGGWAKATVVHEEIAVRERALGNRYRTEILPVRITRHGPIISPLVPDDATTSHVPGEALALRWTALEPGGIQRAVLALNRARDWVSFQAALTDWTVPPQNFVYADVEGQIGYALGGAIPRRAQGDGRLPVPGWTGEWEWTGTIPPEENPHVLNPASGYIVSANNRIVGDDYPHPLPGEWLPGYRAARIREVLLRVPRHDAASFARLHNDNHSLPGRILRDLARARKLPVASDDRFAILVRDILAAWDTLLTADSVAALIATTLTGQLLQRTYRELADPLATVTGLGAFAGLPGKTFLQRALPRVLDLFTGGEGSWLAAGDTPEAILRDAWTATIEELRSAWGTDPTQWRYGLAHHLTLRHPLGAFRPLHRLFNRGPYAVGGDLNTVTMGYRTTAPSGIESYTAPSYRQICDPTTWDQSRSSYPGGQSGHPASPHYDDLIAPWLEGRYHPNLWTRPAIEEATVARLNLTPAE
ncbi:MAG TPA: penicillin acylase family protein [Thermomicrobiales bacterium]